MSSLIVETRGKQNKMTKLMKVKRRTTREVEGEGINERGEEEDKKVIGGQNDQSTLHARMTCIMTKPIILYSLMYANKKELKKKRHLIGDNNWVPIQPEGLRTQAASAHAAASEKWNEASRRARLQQMLEDSTGWKGND